METLQKWILEQAENENVEAVVIGSSQGCNNHIPKGQPIGKVLTWDEAVPWLQYVFSDGYGLPDCNSIVAWTKSWVIFVAQYDGSTYCTRMPRNPIAHMPIMPGG